MKTYTKTTCYLGSECTYYGIFLLEKNILRKCKIQPAYAAVNITKAFRLNSRFYLVCVSIYIHKHIHTGYPIWNCTVLCILVFFFFFFSIFSPTLNKANPNSSSCSQNSSNNLLFKSLLTITKLMMQKTTTNKKTQIFMGKFSYQMRLK